ncbi:MAG: AI-2E family transporter [Deltaproteobacteria bacterium]|nr:MAG: AI-2E family transporter [Deltaproteobacteria bacterium]
MEKSFVSKLFLVVLLGVLILLLRLFWAYISAIILALLIASAFYPLYSRLKKLLRGEERSASLLMTILVVLVLIIPVGGFVGTLSNEAFDFYRRSKRSVSLQKIQQTLEGDSIWAQRLKKARELTGIEVNPETLEQLATSLGKNLGLYLSKQLRSMASNLLNFLIHFFLMTLIIYYIFRDGERLKNYISELLPFPVEQQELVVNKFREMAWAVIVGNGLNGIIQGILAGFGFFLFGLGSPILWGTVIGFLAFLPFIGASIIYVPATVILLVQGKGWIAVGYLAYNAAYSVIMEYLFKPRMIGKGMRMNSLLVFIGILGGIKLFGILGIIYGPLIMTIFITLAEIYRLEYKEAMA